ncbi:MAG: hypothetical protein H7099_18265 [Gemmatimonadaceae bacterium]|nr:hypothetical protein [Gemmatimonadaceae bacterium]
MSTALMAMCAVVATASVHAQVRPTADSTKSPMPMAMAGAGASGMTMGPHQALAMAYGESLTSFARALSQDVTRSHAVNIELARPATTEMRRAYDQMKVHHSAQTSSTAMPMTSSMTKDSGMARSATAPRSTAAMTRDSAMTRAGATRDSIMGRPSPMKRDSAMVKPTTMPSTANATRDPAMTRDSAGGRSTSMPRDATMPPMAGDMEKNVASIGTHLSMLETEVALATPDATKVAEHAAEILKLCEAMMPGRGTGAAGYPAPK